MTGTAPRHLSVVVATYEWPSALDIVLRALSEQRGAPFDVVVADDGSGDETAAVVRRWQSRFELEHVWQPNDRFRKARLLNRAALAARGDYLVFLDGDCVPRIGYAEAIRRAALPGWFVASKRLHLSPQLSRRILAGSLEVWRWSSLRWAMSAPRELVTSTHRQANRPGVLLPIRDRGRPWRPRGSGFRPPYNGYGYTFGVLRSDFERVNGFDMRFGGWDGEDVDIAERLLSAGLSCGWPGPASSVFHLWHADRKKPANRIPREPGAVEAREGLRELVAELAAQETANRVTSSSASSEPV
jgi:glycosyltransferase involved in cell wall biosynthesis